MPYIYSKAVEANKTGVPVMRAMALEFENDRNALPLDTQYMLGESLLVAPVFKESGDVDYYLPEGKWTHLLSNEERMGGKWYSENYDFFSLPLFVRENTILPVGSEATVPDYDYGKDITLHVFNLENSAERSVYNTDGEHIFTVKGERNENTLTFTFDKMPNGAKILLRGVKEALSVQGATLESTPLGTLLTLNAAEIKVIL